MRRRLLGGNRRGEQNIAFGSTVFYDTSGQFSPTNNKVFTVRRSTDNVIDTFSAEDISNGSYSTWLNDATGYLTDWKEENNNYVNLKKFGIANVTLTTTGEISVPNDANMRAAWTTELADTFTAAWVMKEIAGGVQTYDFGAYTANTGFSAALIWLSDINNYRKREFNATIKTQNFAQQNIKFTASNYNNAINNVFVMEVNNGVIQQILVNGISYSSFTAGDTNASFPEFGSNLLTVGDRTGTYTRSGKRNHVSLYLNPTKTPEEISQELIAVYQ